MKIIYGVGALHVGCLGLQTNTITHYSFFIEGKNIWPNTSQRYFLSKSSDLFKFHNTNFLTEMSICLIFCDTVVQGEA